MGFHGELGVNFGLFDKVFAYKMIKSEHFDDSMTIEVAILRCCLQLDNAMGPEVVAG